VDFRLDRGAIDREGTRHVARYQQAWTLRDRPGDEPVVLAIDTHRLLVFPGTGPQIVCY
jgi:hypothetical protein